MAKPAGPSRSTRLSRPPFPASPSLSERLTQPPRRGRPRVTAEQLRERIDAYCRRYGVRLGDDGLPPFPAGKRESAQHREWMAVYKAHRRLASRPLEDDPRQRLHLLAAQRGSCAICHLPLEPADARVDRARPDAVVHPDCLRLLDLARLLGVDAVERARQRL